MIKRMGITVWIGAAMALSLIVGVAPAWSESDGNQSGGSGGKASWSERISMYADFRGRIESFYFSDKVDRHRARYRLRFGFKTDISENVSFNARLATGAAMNSGNQTLGSGDDFDPDGIFIDKAEITIRPFGESMGERGGELAVVIGKMSNPFKSSGQGKDLLVWDADTTPEGIAGIWNVEVAERWDLNADAAYFIIDEESGSENPFVMGFGVQNVFHATDDVDVRVKGTYYRFDDLDAAFFERSRDQGDYGGNTDGLTADTSVDFFDVRGSVGLTANEDWPVTFWGTFLNNTSAVDAGFGKQDTGYSGGVEFGNKKTTVQLGAGYYYVEADALPSLMNDSDVFDGNTNGEGFAVYGARQVWKDTDLAFQLYVSDILDADVQTLQDRSLSKRTRFQGDIKIKF